MIARNAIVWQTADRRRSDRSVWCYVMLLVLQPWLAGALMGEQSVWAGALGGALVFAGLQTLRRAGGETPGHFPMLLLCSTGMIAGLAVDRLSLAPFGLNGLCLPDLLAFWHSVARHWSRLPYMHAGMLLGAVAAFLAGLRGARPAAGRTVAGRWSTAAFEMVCGLAMLGGMDVGAWANALLNAAVAQGWRPGGLMALTWGAMVWGFVLALMLRRAPRALAFHRLHGNLLQGGQEFGVPGS